MGVAFSEHGQPSFNDELSPPPPPAARVVALSVAGQRRRADDMPSGRGQWTNRDVPDGGDPQHDSGLPHEHDLHTDGDALAPADDRQTAGLAMLAGVRSTDTAATRQDKPGARRPRIACTPRQAAIIMLILIGALCASMGLLIRQSVNLARIDQYEAASPTPVITHPTASAEQSAQPVPQDDATAGGQQQSGGGQQEPNDTTESGTPAPDAAGDGRIDINTADATQLQTLNGVGPVTAERIIAYRNQHGRFSSVDDLLNVKGIGAKTLDKLRAQAVAR